MQQGCNLCRLHPSFPETGTQSALVAFFAGFLDGEAAARAAPAAAALRMMRALSFAWDFFWRIFLERRRSWLPMGLLVSGSPPAVKYLHTTDREIAPQRGCLAPVRRRIGERGDQPALSATCGFDERTSRR